MGEGEGLVARDRDALAGRRQRRVVRASRRRQVERAEGHRRRRGQVRRAFQPVFERGMFRRLHQPQMARGQGEPRIAGERRQDRHGARPLAQQRLVPCAGDPVQHRAGDADVAARACEPLQQGRDRLALARAVHDQHDRPAGERGEVGRRAAAALRPVEEAHHALGHGDVGVSVERRRQRFRAHRPGVEVQAGPPGRGSEETRVDIVRPRLVGLHGEALPAERADEARCDRRLAAARGRGG